MLAYLSTSRNTLQKNGHAGDGRMNLSHQLINLGIVTWLLLAVLPSSASEWDEPRTAESQTKPFSLNATLEEERLRLSRQKAGRQNNSNSELNEQPASQQPLVPSSVGPLESAVQAEEFLSNTPLRGLVEKQPKPIPLGLMPGRRFDPNLLPAEGTEEGWYWIPDWAAGIFHRDSQTTLGPTVRLGFRSINLSRTIEDHVTDNEPSGWQMDRKGGIWQYFHLPQTERHEGADFIEYKVILKHQPVEISNTQFITRTFAQSIRVNKFNGIIVMVYQQDDINKSQPTGLGYRQDSLCHWFDQYGRPGSVVNKKRTDLITSESKRIRSFAPVNVWKGKDMKASFHRFLLSHGKADLVPEETRNSGFAKSNFQGTTAEENQIQSNSNSVLKLFSEPRSFGKVQLASGETVDCQITGDSSNLYYKLTLGGPPDFLKAFQSSGELTFELYNEQAFCLGRVQMPMYWKTVVDGQGKVTGLNSSAGVPWTGPEPSKIALWSILSK